MEEGGAGGAGGAGGRGWGNAALRFRGARGAAQALTRVG